MCGARNPRDAHTCRCKERLDLSLDEIRGRLRQRRRLAAIELGVYAVLAVAIIGGPDFGVLGEGYVRLSYANSTENILKALDRMGDFLASEPQGGVTCGRRAGFS